MGRKLSDIKILVVDDESDLRESMKTVFELFGFTVDEAENGQAALQKVQSGNFDLVLSDMRMPVMDGLGLLKNLQNQDVPPPPCVLITSGFTDASVDTIYSLGAIGFMPKPMDATVIRDVIANSLLPLEMRWAKVPNGPVRMEIKKKYSTLPMAVESGELSFGRGGFFLACKDQFPPNNVNVSFEFEFADGTPVKKLNGIGIVRWVRTKEEQGLPPGAGIEIKYVGDDCRVGFAEWIKTQPFKAFIPQS